MVSQITENVDELINKKIEEVRPVVEKFLKAFSCEKEDLVNAITRWTVREEPTLTIMVGTGDNGKTTLSKYVESLYAPFVCSSYPGQEIDQTLVGTCFISEQDTDDFITNESKVKDFPCTNLVYITNRDVTLPSEFGGRKVFKLVFPEPIPPELRDPNVLAKVTPPEARVSGYLWYLRNYDPKDLYAL
jgi:hypothetical protein